MGRQILATFVALAAIAAPASAHIGLTAGDALASYHQAHYWWPAQNNCTLTTGTDRHGVWHATPFIQCTTVPARWASTPPPQFVGLPPQDNGVRVSPEAMCGPVYCATGKPDF